MIVIGKLPLNNRNCPSVVHVPHGDFSKADLLESLSNTMIIKLLELWLYFTGP